MADTNRNNATSGARGTEAMTSVTEVISPFCMFRKVVHISPLPGGASQSMRTPWNRWRMPMARLKFFSFTNLASSEECVPIPPRIRSDSRG